jgi:hypothetical protein
MTVVAQLERETRSGSCHGLAGHGGFLLDCYQALGDEAYLQQARHCGALLQSFRAVGQQGVYRMSRSDITSSDLMLGYAGICSFHLRLAEPAGRQDLILN